MISASWNSYLDGEFKFKPNENDWNGDWENDGDGKIADNGGSNMPGVDAGFYLITVNLNEMTYSTTPITNISIIGGFNDWAINWGGTEDNLTQDGANLNSDGGTHTYKLYLSCENKHHVVIE